MGTIHLKSEVQGYTVCRSHDIQHFILTLNDLNFDFDADF